MRSQPVAFFVEIAEIDLLAKPDADLRAARPVAEDLARKIVAETGYENGDNLGMGRVDDLADAGLGGQHVVRTTGEISLAFGVKANDVAVAFRAYLYQPPHRVFVKIPLPDFPILAKKRRIHRKPAHHEIDKPAERTRVKKLRTNRKI